MTIRVHCCVKSSELLLLALRDNSTGRVWEWNRMSVSQFSHLWKQKLEYFLHQLPSITGWSMCLKRNNSLALPSCSVRGLSELPSLQNKSLDKKWEILMTGYQCESRRYKSLKDMYKVTIVCAIPTYHILSCISAHLYSRD